MVKNMQPRTKKLNATKVLRTLPQNEAFYFFEDINRYTGKSASSLAEFCEITKTVDKKSIIFHFDRQDFVRWAKETLHDPKLAKRINNIKKTKSEKRLRTQIYKVSKKRLKELNNRHRKKRHAKPLKR
jgi:hypothetical protein